MKSQSSSVICDHVVIYYHYYSHGDRPSKNNDLYQKSGTHPQPVHNLQSGVCTSFSVQLFCRSNTSSGRLQCVPSQIGGDFVYLQEHI